MGVAQYLNVVEDTSAAITLAGTDGENDALSFRIVTQPGHGTLAAHFFEY